MAMYSTLLWKCLIMLKFGVYLGNHGVLLYKWNQYDEILKKVLVRRPVRLYLNCL